MMGSCGNCHRTMTFNPKLVPSFNNVPFCKECVELANPIRKEKGLPEIVVSDDAYEPIREEEL